MAPRELTIALGRAERVRFQALLQRGVATRIPAGRSVLEFLTADLGLDPAYVRERITTVFLDGEVVDVLEDATLGPGSRLALSAAMPGVAGATLRRGGPYAAMRAAITRSAGRASAERGAATAVVRVKLFNLLLDEIGPALLARGIVLDREEAIRVLGGAAAASSGLPSGGEVELRIRFS